MSFGFGIGDLLAVANTIERIVSDIKEYRSAPSSFQRLAIELELLTKTCTQLLQIEPTEADDATRMDNIRKSMCLCLGPLKAFAEKMRGSEDSLGVSKWLAENQEALNEEPDRGYNGGQGHQNTLRRRYRSVKDRIHWSKIESKEVDELRAVVAGQLVAVDTLLNVRTWVCLTEAKTQSKEISERLQSLINDTRAASDESRQFYLSAKAVAISQWDEIQRWQTLNEEERIELKKVILTVSESSEETRSWTKMLANIVGLWGEKLQDQVDTLTRVNNIFSTYMRTLIASCASITEMIERNFRTLLNVYEVLVRIERMILSKAIEMPHLRFDDPFGETLALPYQMCNTWQHFTWLLGAMFQDKPGKRLVQRGSFMIMTAKFNKIIDAKQWEHAVRSGDHLSMSMVLRRRSMNAQQCPRCSTIWEDDSHSQQKGRTCNACEFWFSTLDEEPDTAGRIVTMGGERIELYEVPDAPKNDYSTSGPPVLREGHMTSSQATPVSIAIEDETDEDTSLFRRIHFVIQQLGGDTTTVVDISKFADLENFDISFSPSGWRDKPNDGAEILPKRDEQPIISTTPTPTPEGFKANKAEKAGKAKKMKVSSSQISSEDRPIPPIYRSPIPSPYYNAPSSSDYLGRSGTPPPYYYGSSTSTYSRRSRIPPPYSYGSSTSTHPRRSGTPPPYSYGYSTGTYSDRSPTPTRYDYASSTSSYARRSRATSPYYHTSSSSTSARSGTYSYADSNDGSRISRPPYSTQYDSQCIRGSTSKVSYASRSASRENKPDYADEVDAIDRYNRSSYNSYASMSYHENRPGLGTRHALYYSDHYYNNRSAYYDYGRRTPYETANMQSVSARRPNARRTTRTPAERPKTAIRSSSPRPATEADRIAARIPAGYSLKNWDPTESPIILLGSVFDANSLGKWIYDWTAYHHYPGSPISELAGELWLLLIKVTGRVNLAECRSNRIHDTEQREVIEEFLDSGYRIWERLKKLLKVCEDHMWKAYKGDNSKRSDSNDGEPQSPENQNRSENGENDKNSPQKDEQEDEVESNVKASTYMHTQDQRTADIESEPVQAAQEPTVAEQEAGHHSAQIPAVHSNLEDKKRGLQKTKGSKGPQRVQMGKSSGIAFVEAIFGRDKELERTEKLMANMRLWIMRFETNCGEILSPKAAKQPVRRGRRSSIELNSYTRPRSTTPKARAVYVDSVTSGNNAGARSLTPEVRPAQTDSTAAACDGDVPELAGASPTTNKEQSSSPVDPEQQEQENAKEWESLTLTTKKKKKKKKKVQEPVAENPHPQPEIVEKVEVMEGSGEREAEPALC